MLGHRGSASSHLNGRRHLRRLDNGTRVTVRLPAHRLCIALSQRCASRGGGGGGDPEEGPAPRGARSFDKNADPAGCTGHLPRANSSLNLSFIRTRRREMKGAGVANAPLRANDTEAAQPRLVSSPRGAELRSHPLEAAPFARTWIPRQ
ncbi:unnamed protein product [Lampetra planeri]